MEWLDCAEAIGALVARKAQWSASRVVHLGHTVPTVPLDRVGKVAQGPCAMSSVEAGDFLPSI